MLKQPILMLLTLWSCFPGLSKAPPQPRALGRQQLQATVAVVVGCGTGTEAIDALLAPPSNPNPAIDDFDNITHTIHATSRGSGVIVDSRHVLTAAHVVACRSIATVGVIDTRARTMLLAHVLWEDKAHDVAMLILSDATIDIPPPLMADVPAVETSVCKLSGLPRLSADCGVVDTGRTLIKTGKHSRVAVHATMPVIPGNSGSAVYDSAGRLVGIAVARDNDGGGWFIPIVDVGMVHP